MVVTYAMFSPALAAGDAISAENIRPFHFVQKPGLYGVGLKIVEHYDRSRVYQHEEGVESSRPLQTLIWYPSMPSRAKPMTVGDYGKLLSTETSFDERGASAHTSEWLAAMAPARSTSLWAVHETSAAPGRFPVVIYAPSFSAMSWENADLCEYLASHGYVVLASPSLGSKTRMMTTDLAGIDAQARDIAFLIDYSQTLFNTDPAKLAVLGFSWGGLSNLFAAARDDRIDALVALDGSMRYYAGLVKEAVDVHPQAMKIPLLYFAQGHFAFEDLPRYLTEAQSSGPNVLNAWTHGDLLMVYMLGLVHQEFSSMYQRREDMWTTHFLEWQKADYGREDGVTGYGWVARYTLCFLNGYLKGDTSAMAFLKQTPAENGVPEHHMGVRFRPGKRD